MDKTISENVQHIGSEKIYGPKHKSNLAVISVTYVYVWPVRSFTERSLSFAVYSSQSSLIKSK